MVTWSRFAILLQLPLVTIGRLKLCRVESNPQGYASHNEESKGQSIIGHECHPHHGRTIQYLDLGASGKLYEASIRGTINTDTGTLCYAVKGVAGDAYRDV